MALLLTMLIGGNVTAQNKNRVVHVAKLQIDPAQLDKYTAAMKEIGETSLRTEPGVLMLYSVDEKARPNYIMILEVYADSAAYAAHPETAHFKKYKEVTKNMVKSLKLIDVVPIVAGIKPNQ